MNIGNDGHAALEPVRKLFEEFHDLGNEQMRGGGRDAM